MLPILSCFIIFCLWLRYELRKSSNQVEKTKNTLIENESMANSTRKKSISSLNYITISEKSILFIKINDSKIKNIQKEFEILKDKKILNLSNMSNTELKLNYGPANLPVLSEADENFSSLVRNLHKYAEALKDLDMKKEAIEVLEYAIDIGSDMSISYKLLSELYKGTDNSKKIDYLIKKAETLDSLMKEPILNYLKSFQQK